MAESEAPLYRNPLSKKKKKKKIHRLEAARIEYISEVRRSPAFLAMDSNESTSQYIPSPETCEDPPSGLVFHPPRTGVISNHLACFDLTRRYMQIDQQLAKGTAVPRAHKFPRSTTPPGKACLLIANALCRKRMSQLMDIRIKYVSFSGYRCETRDTMRNTASTNGLDHQHGLKTISFTAMGTRRSNTLRSQATALARSSS